MTPFTAAIIAGIMFVCGYALGHYVGSESATKDTLRRLGASFRAAERERARNEYR